MPQSKRPQDMTIKDFAAAEDAELRGILGLEKSLEDFKEVIAEANKLSGKARTEFENRLQNRFAPSVYPGDFRYMLEDAQRAANPKKNSPAELID